MKKQLVGPIRAIVQKFRELKLSSYTAVSKHFKLESLGGGLYRQVYRLVGTNLVVKFPGSYPEITKREILDHAEMEYYWCQKFRRDPRWQAFRRHAPKIHYYDAASGVTLMTYYELAPDEPKLYRDAEWFNKLFDYMCIANGEPENENRTMDLGYGNIGLKPNGDYVFLDLGYLS